MMKVPVFLFAMGLQILSAQSVSWLETFDNQYIPSYFEGNIARFSILNKRLHLNHIFPAAQNETELIRYTPIKKGQPLVWEIHLSLDFSPSPQNNLKIYIGSSHPNLGTSENAWFLQVGGETGNQDKISLYRQKNKQKILLAQGEPGLFTGAVFRSAIRVSLNENKQWTVDTKTDSSQTWKPAFTYKSSEDLHSFYTGLLLYYTSGRARHFSFDDWKIDGLLPDETLPRIEKWGLISPNQLQINFSKPLDTAINSNPDFEILDADGKKIPVYPPFVDSLQPFLLMIRFDTIRPNELYQISGRVMDKSKNKNTFDLSFERKSGFAPDKGDLLFSEILAIPLSGKQGEFIEVYNPTSRTLELSTFRLIVQKNVLEIPKVFIAPNQYFIFHHVRDSLYFLKHPFRLGLSNFPALPNSGGTVEMTERGMSIDKMQYGHYPDWQHELTAGKSLERRSMNHSADCMINWTPCLFESGSSPGDKNSVQLLAPPNFVPFIAHIFPQAPDTLLLFSTMPLKNPDESDEALFQLSPLEAKKINIGIKGNIWIIHLKETLISGKTYTFSLTKGLKNCLGQENNQPQSVRIALPQKPQIGENIFINEILFDPLSNQKPFIEIQANTQYPIDIYDLHWGNPSEIAYPHRVLFPYEPYAISENPRSLAEQYETTTDKTRIIEGNIPNLNRSRGTISLYYGNIETDKGQYDKIWHSPWLKTTTGISLERKDAQGNGQLAQSWASAAGFKTGATPGKENTSSGKEQNLLQQKAVLDPVSFDGVQQLQYCILDSHYTGSQVNIRIFDIFGNEVHYLVKNQILGNKDEIVWNGKRENDEALPKGTYIWWIEILRIEGDRTVVKLVSKLE
jgi:hypothetical protein